MRALRHAHRIVCRPDDEAGQVLVLVLGFLVVVGLLTAALANQSIPSFVHSAVVTDVDNRVAAADQGINYGIQTLQTDSTLCPVNAATPTSLPPYVTPDSQLTVNVTCQTSQGFGPGVFGWAVITNDTSAASITDSSGGNKTITGPVFNAGGWNLNPANVLTVKDGKVINEGPGCSLPANTTLVVTPNPPFTRTCSTMPVPVPPHQLPASVPAAAPAPQVMAGCTILFPGTYTTANAPNLAGNVYMVSGVYYFNGLGNLQVGSSLFGGQPGPTESQEATTGSPCSSDNSAGRPNSGSGVELIFGGNTTLSIGNNSTMEFYSRQPPNVANGGTDNGATPGVSLYQVPCASPAWSTGCAPQTSGWSATTLAPDTQFMNMGNGAHVFGAVHGAVYGPQGSVGAFATSSALTVLGGGTDVYDLTLQSSASASGQVVSVALTPLARATVLKAVVQGPGRQFATRAVIQIANDVNRTTTIGSWRTCQDNNCPT